jgi:L-lactate dehydrogenase complex protein LldG
MMEAEAHVPDLISIFECNARDAAAGVFIVENNSFAIRAAVENLTAGANSIVLGLGEFIPREIADELHRIHAVVAKPSDEQLSIAGAGVSDAFAGVASSGSVCIAMGPPLVAAASLLTPLHVVILPASRIVERPRDLFDPVRFGGEGLRRDLVFITGPSATADMGPLVRGVHGPHSLQILVVKDSDGH